jgi:hypothetical protein
MYLLAFKFQHNCKSTSKHHSPVTTFDHDRARRAKSPRSIWSIIMYIDQWKRKNLASSFLFSSAEVICSRCREKPGSEKENQRASNGFCDLSCVRLLWSQRLSAAGRLACQTARLSSSITFSRETISRRSMIDDDQDSRRARLARGIFEPKRRKEEGEDEGVASLGDNHPFETITSNPSQILMRLQCSHSDTVPRYCTVGRPHQCLPCLGEMGTYSTAVECSKE